MNTYEHLFLCSSGFASVALLLFEAQLLLKSFFRFFLFLFLFLFFFFFLIGAFCVLAVRRGFCLLTNLCKLQRRGSNKGTIRLPRIAIVVAVQARYKLPIFWL
jgi:hypothetical protein